MSTVKVNNFIGKLDSDSQNYALTCLEAKQTLLDSLGILPIYQSEIQVAELMRMAAKRIDELSESDCAASKSFARSPDFESLRFGN
jgi:hypothetical protein